MNPPTYIKPETSPERMQESKSSIKLALFIALLALSFTAIGITAGYKHWLRIHVKTKQSLSEINELKEKLTLTADKKMLDSFVASFKSTTDKERKTLTEALSKLDHISKQTHYAASTVKQQIELLTAKQEQPASHIANQHGTPYAYVPFLLQSAQRQLHFLHDKKGTLMLLKIADQMLIETGTKKHIALRQHIAEDIATLEHYKPIDIDQLSDTIIQLEADIPPLMTLEENKKTNKDQTINTTNTTNTITAEEKTLTTTVKQYLKQSIKLHKANSAPRQLLAESDKQRIDQLIQLRLESLHLMLLQRQDKAYHWQINRLIKTLSYYYPEQQTTSWINTLENLANVRLNTEPPTLVSSQYSSFASK